MSADLTAQRRALEQLARCDFAFADLLSESELASTLNPRDDGSGTLLTLCFSAWTALHDIRDHVGECIEMKHWLPLADVQVSFLRPLAIYLGIVERRMASGEQLFDSEGATAIFRKEARTVRAYLLLLFGEVELRRLEANGTPRERERD